MDIPPMEIEQQPAAAPADIIKFWFSDDSKPLWFAKSEPFDRLIATKFLLTYTYAKEGKLDAWKEKPESLVALIIILDQFPRNMFRNKPESFATDEQALALAKYGISHGFDKLLANPEHQKFFYMPFMHSEHLADQTLALQLFKDDPLSSDYAKRHYEIIKRFGRFPHRNAILGRVSTPEEIEFLKQPGSAF